MSEAERADDWEDHWGQYAASASLNPAQTLRHRAILRALRDLPGRLERLLDVGSGQGDFLGRAVAADVAREFAGFELSASGVAISRRKVPQASFLQVDLFSAPPGASAYNGWATAAVCSDVIEHVDDPIGFLRLLRSYLCDGGHLILTVPGGPMSKFDHHIGHRRHYDDVSIRETLSAAGFEVEHVWLAGFPFFNLYRMLVILRGKRLIADASSSDATQLNGVARLVMRAFEILFRFNLRSFPLGWQIVALARKPAAT